MSGESELLRRQLLALSQVDRELQDEVVGLNDVRRLGLGGPWLEELAEAEPDGPRPFLVRARTGSLYLIDGAQRRAVASGLLAKVLEDELGARHKVDDQKLDEWPEGPPVEVLEAPAGPPFVVIAGQRRPLRGLPLPHPVATAEAERFGPGAELDLSPGRKRAEAKAAEAKLPQLPSFLIIGAQKSATRWLRANLGQHPEIYAAPSEIEFFNNEEHYDGQGVLWYRAQFGGWNGEAVIGEATPGYMMWRHQPEVIARRIKSVVPEARLIAILRNPVDRAYSAMVHHMKRERLPAASRLIDLVRATPPESDFLGLIAGGWYAASLRPYARLFGDQLLVLMHDDIDRDAVGVYAKALSHLGAAPEFVPSGLEKVRFSNQPKVSDADEPLGREERIELFEFFRSDVAELETMLGRDLSSWDPSSASSEPAAP